MVCFFRYGETILLFLNNLPLHLLFFQFQFGSDYFLTFGKYSLKDLPTFRFVCQMSNFWISFLGGREGGSELISVLRNMWTAP